MVKLGIVCFANASGLGAQTRRLTYMLKPHRLLVVDSSGFSKNKEQNWHWYDQFTGYKVHGFPTDFEIKKFLEGLTHVLVCENPLNFFLFSWAERMGIKTFCQSNYEFCDNLAHPHLPLPSKFLMPSYWMVEEMKSKFGEDRVMYLPPPLDMAEFKVARETNLARKGKVNFLHIIGTLAAHDRNGTLDLLKALKYTEAEFNLTIKSQHPLPEEYMVTDHRITYKVGNETENSDLYKDFDCLILPRRYGGLSLTTNEGLASGLPILMPDISPNNQLLPKEWLFEAAKTSQFMARVPIDVYSSDPHKMAEKIDWFVGQDIEALKLQAFQLAYDNFNQTVLKERYEALWSL